MTRFTRSRCSVLGLALVAVLAAGWTATAEVVQLEAWLTGDPSAVQSLLPEFHEAHPNIRVTVSPLSWTGYEEKVFLAFATDTAPDIIMTGASFLWHVMGNNLGIPLNRYTDGWEGLADFAPGALQAMTHEGKLYGLPLMAPSRALWYRKDLFMEHGLDAEDAPETWEEIRDAARRIVRFEGDTVTRIGMTLTEDILVHAFLTNGVRSFTEDLRRAAFNTPEGLEALEFWSELARDMLYLGRERQLPGGFYGGTIGMMYGYVNPRTVMSTDPRLFDQIGGPAVMERRAKYAYTYPDWVYITTQSEHPDEAWEFMKWLTDPVTLVNMRVADGHPSPRRSSYTHPYYETPEGALTMRHFIEATLQYGHGFELTPDTSVRLLRAEMWNKVVNQEWSPRQGLEWMEQQYNVKLDEVFSERK